MERHRGRAPVGMSELLVRAALAHFDEAEPFKTRDDLACPKYWTPSHD